VKDGAHLGWQRLFAPVTDSEIFAGSVHDPASGACYPAEAPESIYADLATWGWVVPVDYGVGRYSGWCAECWTHRT